jgi:heptosyltransferase-2
LEFWGLGDLALAVPFLRTAAGRGGVTVVARPQWEPLLRRFCPGVGLVPFHAPWTAFRGKYHLLAWPWRELRVLVRDLRARRFEAGVSARCDPRDHLVLRLAGATRRIGFPRAGSALLLTAPLAGGRTLHRARAWRQIAGHLGWEPAPPAGRIHPMGTEAAVVLHSGAGRPTRVWPLERFAGLARRLRHAGRAVRVLCDAGQLDGWRRLGEADARVPAGVDGLLDSLADAAGFVGNDSGPGHVAALCGVPTFTIFGPQLPELFAPSHPQAAWVDGAPCRYKPCFDSCRFAEPNCIVSLTFEDVWTRLDPWLASAVR